MAVGEIDAVDEDTNRGQEAGCFTELFVNFF